MHTELLQLLLTELLVIMDEILVVCYQRDFAFLVLTTAQFHPHNRPQHNPPQHQVYNICMHISLYNINVRLTAAFTILLETVFSYNIRLVYLIIREYSLVCINC